MSASPRTIRVAGYCLLTQPGKILLCRLSNMDVHNGWWTLPGGGMEFGEHPEEAAVREAYEETGFEVKITGLACIDNFVKDDFQCLRHVYFADIVGGELRHEMDNTTDLAEWVPFEGIESERLVDLAELGTKLARERAS